MNNQEYVKKIVSYLFHHKVFKSCFFCCFSIPLNFCCLLFNLIPIKVKEMSFSRCQSGKFQITNVINISCIFQNSRDIQFFCLYQQLFIELFSRTKPSSCQDRNNFFSKKSHKIVNYCITLKKTQKKSFCFQKLRS